VSPWFALGVYFHFGSLGFAVMNRQFRRQLHCRPPAVQLLAQLSREFPMSHHFKGKERDAKRGREIHFAHFLRMGQIQGKFVTYVKTPSQPNLTSPCKIQPARN
jgi:hypothetical protein